VDRKREQFLMTFYGKGNGGYAAYLGNTLNFVVI